MTKKPPIIDLKVYQPAGEGAVRTTRMATPWEQFRDAAERRVEAVRSYVDTEIQIAEQLGPKDYRRFVNARRDHNVQAAGKKHAARAQESPKSHVMLELEKRFDDGRRAEYGL